MIALAPYLFGVALLPVPQEPSVFAVNREVDPPRVSADLEAITAYRALSELSRALGWSVIAETDHMRSDLDQVSVDLSFEDQDPRMIAQLIAAAGGADVAFDDRSDHNGARFALHVISSPDPTTEAGRQRLRERSAQWYQNFLADELRIDPTVVKEAMQVRMHLGHLMMEGGDFEGAARYFKQIYDVDRSHDFVPTALLRMAESFYELQDYENAEHWARELMKNHPSLPETAAATVLLGRVLLATGRYETCRETMEFSLLRLSDSPEIIDLYLLVGEAEMRLGRPGKVLDHMEILGGAQSFRDLNREQFLHFNLLYGYGGLTEGDKEKTMEALELFLILGEGDPRRGQAFVMLGKVYLALNKYLEARAAALEASTYMGSMDEEWRTEARKLYARTALAVGDKEAAFRDLESEVRRTFDQELILFLIDEFLNEKRYQRAITTAGLLDDEDTPHGDQARYRKVLAMWRQARQTNVIKDFPPKAVDVAKRIQDKELQSKVAEIIGQAYEAVGELQKASEAYRGILR